MIRIEHPGHEKHNLHLEVCAWEKAPVQTNSSFKGQEKRIYLGDEKMGKDDVNSTFDFDSDPEFSDNFYKNIERAFSDSEVETPKTEQEDEHTEEHQDSEETPTEPTTDEIAATVAAKKPEALDKASEDDIEEELSDINASLARKICEEMDVIGVEAAKNGRKKQNRFRIQSGIILTLLCVVGLGFFFGFTKPGNQLLLSIGVNISGNLWTTMTGSFDDTTDVVEDIDHIDEEDLDSTADTLDPATIVWPDHPGEGRHVEGVYNILLLGEEAIGSGTSRGRTDVIVIATMNTITKELKLTSLMRDTFVQIPGYKDNKLNSAYEKGGLDLLYETIALNFDIRLDGCAMVNFEDFEKIIDKLGGLELTLTAGEAKYLNTTNYISNPANRNVHEGKQPMNGNQVLGYARVRKRATITGNNNDYGRTDRHRIILNAIFDKYKSKSEVELASMMLQLLPMITTDIDNETFKMLLNSFIEMGTTQISQLRIPDDGAFDDAMVRGMDVLVPDLQKNIKTLHDFIFGDEALYHSQTPTGAATPAENEVGTAVIN